MKRNILIGKTENNLDMTPDSRERHEAYQGNYGIKQAEIERLQTKM